MCITSGFAKQWRRQLWGTGARAPLDFQLIFFRLFNSQLQKLVKFDSMWLPI